jgi:hypothetical protein
MPSIKQEVLADLMHWLICLSRGPQSYGLLARILRKRDYDRVLEDLHLIHKIPLSILVADFTRNDVDFINWGGGVLRRQSWAQDRLPHRGQFDRSVRLRA